MEAKKQRRRTGSELEEAIRGAILEEVLELGYNSLTFEGVARRAGTSKTVLYRRYDSIPAMVTDAWVHLTPSLIPSIDTGTLRGDLMELGRVFQSRAERVGVETLRGLLAGSSTNLLPVIGARSWDVAHELIGHVLLQAAKRGEIPTAELSPHVVLLPFVLCLHHVLFFGHLDEVTLAELVDDVCLPLMRG